MILTEAMENERLTIVSVNTDYRHKRHLENLSVLKGEQITCLYNRAGDVVIKVKDGRLAINREFACSIEVESLNPEDYYQVTKPVKHEDGTVTEEPVFDKHGNAVRKMTEEAQVRFKEENEKAKAEAKQQKELNKRKNKEAE